MGSKAIIAVSEERAALKTVDDVDLLNSGLNAKQVQERQALGLSNRQDFDSSRSLMSILRGNLFTLFNAVVGGSFVLLIVLGQWKDALFGFAVVSNVLIGIVQEFTSKRTLDRLALLNAPYARVKRGGELVQLPITEVVLDDLLELRSGDQIAADARLLAVSGLQVDESLLTGESEPVEKQIGDELLAGSGVVGGSAQARVTRVGLETYSNKLTIEARRYSLVSSELRNALKRIIKWISWLLLPIMIIAVNGQMQAAGGWSVAFSTGAWVDAMVGSIAGIIAMVPQGLVLITSISFALAAVQLARQNVLVQELPAVEGLARVDVICFDKTGTLTEGEMVFDDLVSVNGSETSTLQQVLGHFAHHPDANATAVALRSMFQSGSELRELGTVPFSSLRKWSGFELQAKGENTAWILGAPELVLVEDTQAQKVALAECLTKTERGKRTLVLARSDAGLSGDALPKDLQPAAILTLREKVRPDAHNTLAYFAEQGVAVRIISGDHPNTVAAVAYEAGLRDFGAPVDGRTLPQGIGELADLLETHQIFGRVTPEQKRDMIKALQSRNHVVAMTGDGVNDALALKHADLGIAMGTGAAITKAASRLVLLDGQFATLPGVVAEGRRVIANIERISRLFLTKTAWAMSISVIFGLALWKFPWLPRQLSAVDGFTIGLPSFALALLPNPRRYQPGFLKRSLVFCIPAGVVVALSITSFSLLANNDGWTEAEAQTGVSLLLSLTGLYVLSALARPLNGIKVAIIAAMLLMFLGLFGIPLIGGFFGFVWLSAEQFMIVGVIATIAISLMEAIQRISDRVQ